MNPVALHKWQYADYHEVHGAKANLWLHLFAVPLFVAGNLLTVIGLGLLSWWIPLVGVLVSMLSMLAQGNGHKMEHQAPKPFTSPLNAVGRIFVEQWVTFPRFFFSGGWFRALRNAGSNST